MTGTRGIKTLGVGTSIEMLRVGISEGKECW